MFFSGVSSFILLVLGNSFSLTSFFWTLLLFLSKFWTTFDILTFSLGWFLFVFFNSFSSEYLNSSILIFFSFFNSSSFVFLLEEFIILIIFFSSLCTFTFIALLFCIFSSTFALLAIFGVGFSLIGFSLFSLIFVTLILLSLWFFKSFVIFWLRIDFLSELGPLFILLLSLIIILLLASFSIFSFHDSWVNKGFPDSGLGYNSPSNPEDLSLWILKLV